MALDEKVESDWTKEQIQEFERSVRYDGVFRIYNRIRKFETAYVLLEAGFEQEALALLSF